MARRPRTPPLSTPCGTFARRSFWAGSGPDRHRWGGGLVVRAGGRTSSGLHLARRSRVSGQSHEATLEGHTFLGHPSPVRQNWEAKPDGHTGNPKTPSGHPTAHEIDGINKESPLCFTSVSMLGDLRCPTAKVFNCDAKGLLGLLRESSLLNPNLCALSMWDRALMMKRKVAWVQSEIKN